MPEGVFLVKKPPDCHERPRADLAPRSRTIFPEAR